MTHLVPVLRPVLGAPFRRGSLYRVAGEVPSFHIAPARTQNARDLITGNLLGSYNSASPAWAVGPDGVLFQPAANAPVIEYDPVTLQCLGARIWGATTNLHIYSEDATQWLTPVNITLTADQGTAPSNTLTADRYIETTANGLHSQEGSAFSFVSGTQYTYSVFVESIGGRNFEIGYPVAVAGASTRFARFDLSAGTIQGTDSGITATITAYPGGRYRCSATVTATASVSARIGNFINNASFSRSYAGDTSKGLFIWGAQINTGPLAPYVPTGATAASSTADVWSIGGSDFTRIWNQSQDTIYIDWNLPDVNSTRDNQTLFQADAAGLPAVAVRMGFSAGSRRLRYYAQTSAGAFVYVIDGLANTSAVGKTAFAFSSLNDSAASENGAAVLTDSIGDFTNQTTTQILVGSTGSAFANGYIRELAIFGSRRPNANLQAMTQ